MRFDAVRLALPVGAEVPGRGVHIETVDGHPYFVRGVNPSVHHIRSWISSVGAAIAIEDLDGDGLPNDASWVDPRVNRIVIRQLVANDAPEAYPPRFLDAPDFATSNSSYAPDRPETVAPMGTVAGDFNEDGRIDLLAYYWGRSPVLFLRNESSWQDAASSLYDLAELCNPPERWFTNAATQADFDGDGHVDLVFGNYFQDACRLLDTRSDEAIEMQASMSHADNGGCNRIFLWDGTAEGGAAFTSAKITLQKGSRTLDGTQTAHVLRRWTLAVAAANFDANPQGRPGIYFGNDFGADTLLLPLPGMAEEKGRLHFRIFEGRRDVWMPKSKVVGHDSYKGMSALVTDLDRDGIPDIFVSNIAADWALQESHFAYMSRKPGIMRTPQEFHDDIWRNGYMPLVDRSTELGLSQGCWGWDRKTAAFDNGRRPVMVVAQGFVRGHKLAGPTGGDNPGPLAAGRWSVLHELATANDVMVPKPKSWFPCQPGDNLSGSDSMAFMVAHEDGRYYDCGTPLSDGGNTSSTPMIGRGIAVSDVNGDGLPDFAAANQWEDSYLFLNRHDPASAGACIQLRLLHPLAPGASDTRVFTGPAKDAPTQLQGRPAIGATARFALGPEEIHMDCVDGGNGHSGKNTFDLYFGLGPNPPGSIKVHLTWRNPEGRLEEDDIEIAPGHPGDPAARYRHTVLLRWTTSPNSP